MVEAGGVELLEETVPFQLADLFDGCTSRSRYSSRSTLQISYKGVIPFSMREKRLEANPSHLQWTPVS
jgi:hypothetical protein